MSQELIGFFDSPADARRVREEATAAGLICINVTVPQCDSERQAFWVWQKTKSILGILDEEELQGPTHRVGTVAVTLDAESVAQQARAIEIMQRHHPVDLEFCQRQ